MTFRVSVFVILLLPGFSAANNDYMQQHAMAVSACEAIGAREYQSGLALNPDGYRSYYLRSQCDQKAAIRFRDIKLCAKVRQRRALFSSSWGYSKSNCKKLVEEGIAKDRDAIEQMKKEYAQGHVQLSDFRIERNGNGRDFDNSCKPGIFSRELPWPISRSATTRRSLFFRSTSSATNDKRSKGSCQLWSAPLNNRSSPVTRNCALGTP